MIEKLKTFLEFCGVRLALGYVHNASNKHSIRKMMKEADIKMYADKEKFYLESGEKRR